MRYLCFGGSFNPVHNGHLVCSRAVAQEAGFDRVVLIPSAVPPHKPRQADMANAQDRLAMCRLAAATDSNYEVDDVELKRDAPSYTLETARQLRRLRGWQSVHWLIGADQVAQLPNWHQPEALLREVELLIMARPGWSFDWDAVPPEYRFLRDKVVRAPLLDISATEIRRRVRQGEPIAGMVPPEVERYIHERGLYR